MVYNPIVAAAIRAAQQLAARIEALRHAGVAMVQQRIETVRQAGVAAVQQRIETVRQAQQVTQQAAQRVAQQAGETVRQAGIEPVQQRIETVRQAVLPSLISSVKNVFGISGVQKPVISTIPSQNTIYREYIASDAPLSFIIRHRLSELGGLVMSPANLEAGIRKTLFPSVESRSEYLKSQEQFRSEVRGVQKGTIAEQILYPARSYVLQNIALGFGMGIAAKVGVSAVTATSALVAAKTASYAPVVSRGASLVTKYTEPVVIYGGLGFYGLEAGHRVSHEPGIESKMVKAVSIGVGEFAPSLLGSAAGWESAAKAVKTVRELKRELKTEFIKPAVEAPEGLIPQKAMKYEAGAKLALELSGEKPVITKPLDFTKVETLGGFGKSVETWIRTNPQQEPVIGGSAAARTQFEKARIPRDIDIDVLRPAEAAKSLFPESQKFFGRKNVALEINEFTQATILIRGRHGVQFLPKTEIGTEIGVHTGLPFKSAKPIEIGGIKYKPAAELLQRKADTILRQQPGGTIGPQPHRTKDIFDFTQQAKEFITRKEVAAKSAWLFKEWQIKKVAELETKYMTYKMYSGYDFYPAIKGTTGYIKKQPGVLIGATFTRRYESPSPETYEISRIPQERITIRAEPSYDIYEKQPVSKPSYVGVTKEYEPLHEKPIEISKYIPEKKYPDEPDISYEPVKPLTPEVPEYPGYPEKPDRPYKPEIPKSSEYPVYPEKVKKPLIHTGKKRGYKIHEKYKPLPKEKKGKKSPWYPAALESVTTEEFQTGKIAKHLRGEKVTQKLFKRFIRGSGAIPTAAQFKGSKFKNKKVKL